MVRVLKRKMRLSPPLLLYDGCLSSSVIYYCCYIVRYYHNDQMLPTSALNILACISSHVDEDSTSKVHLYVPLSSRTKAKSLGINDSEIYCG
mmetsp:Transcript_7561/g.16486  ORF Transcript_7561/g.16486 Transcript_7561/m.16486 type:complete len:92 (+) Transcript_7561:1109-1384(+)